MDYTQAVKININPSLKIEIVVSYDHESLWGYVVHGFSNVGEGYCDNYLSRDAAISDGIQYVENKASKDMIEAKSRILEMEEVLVAIENIKAGDK